MSCKFACCVEEKKLAVTVAEVQGIFRNSKQLRDRQNGNAFSTHESKQRGWSVLQPSSGCRNAASALPLCPMMGCVP